LIAAFLVALVVSGVTIFLLREETEFSDAPAAADLALSESGGIMDLHFATCRKADDIPKLLVWEESEDGRLRWATFFRTGGPRSAYWLSRREDGITFEPGEANALPPVEDVRVTVRVMPQESDPIEVVGLPLEDLPESDSGDVLLADGSTAKRQAWAAEREKAC
jgi:hypothetical protein